MRNTEEYERKEKEARERENPVQRQWIRETRLYRRVSEVFVSCLDSGPINEVNVSRRGTNLLPLMANLDLHNSRHNEQHESREEEEEKSSHLEAETRNKALSPLELRADSSRDRPKTFPDFIPIESRGRKKGLDTTDPRIFDFS